MSWEFNLAESFTHLLWCFVTKAGCCVTALAAPGKTPTAAQKELRLIQSKSDIENPRIIVKAVPLIFRMFATCDNTQSLQNTVTDIHGLILCRDYVNICNEFIKCEWFFICLVSFAVYERKIKFLTELQHPGNTKYRLFEKILLMNWLLCMDICAKSDEHLVLFSKVS